MRKAIGKWIHIKEEKESIKKTEGGLELAEKHREDLRYRKAEVISSGPEEFKSGDIIWFDRVAGHYIDDEAEVKVIGFGDVVAVDG